MPAQFVVVTGRITNVTAATGPVEFKFFTRDADPDRRAVLTLDRRKVLLDMVVELTANNSSTEFGRISRRSSTVHPA
jgi:hypothetical protein